ncbi:unnamed protein product [Rotaria sp. Silwood2]|nr:unnamed protein product [Rotaria sp. Silwood2]CAF4040848.1 unnamed protein product [Rotaria sp. Silwood2]
MPYANNATITTELSSCSQIVNVTQTVQDLYNLYQNKSSSLVSSVFYNISITNFNCTTQLDKYFEQVIIFTQSISIRIQVALVSIYFDYITGNGFSINGFFIERERPIYLSSISLNYSKLFSTPNSSVLNSWQIGLICSLSGFILLICFLLVGYICRRRSRSKHFTLTPVNFFDDMKSLQKNGIPLGEAFQRAATIVQPKQRNNMTIAWIHDDSDKNTTINKKNYINVKSTRPYYQGTFIDHAKIHDSVFPSNISKNLLKPIYVSNNHIHPLASKIHSIAVIARPVSGTSKSQLKSIIGQLEEDKLDPSDSISLRQLNSINAKRLSTSMSGQYANTLSLDESLHDEDAWMSILDVANAELDILNRLENEQNRIKTIV